MAKPLADRVDALATRNAPPRKWHRVIVDGPEIGAEIRASRSDIAPEDGIILYRLI